MGKGKRKTKDTPSVRHNVKFKIPRIAMNTKTNKAHVAVTKRAADVSTNQTSTVRSNKYAILSDDDLDNEMNDCPKRLDYIRMRMNQSKRQRESKSSVPRQSQPSQGNQNSNQGDYFSSKVTSNLRYSDWFKTSNDTHSSSHQPANAKHPSDDLLPNDVLLTMMKELFVSLRSCRSKFDQLEAVTGIVLKYSAYPHDV